MYTIITSDNLSKHSREMESLSKIDLLYYENDWIALEKNIRNGRLKYLIYSDADSGALGGMKIKKSDDNLIISRCFTNAGFKLQETWILEEVFFDVPDDSYLHDQPLKFEDCCRKFYKGLYEIIQLLGVNQDQATILMVNDIEEHENIKYFGEWPFEMDQVTKCEETATEFVLACVPVNIQYLSRS